jgi:SAM-dependent methyltransferase
MTADNIIYRSQELKKYFSANRIRWDDFYPSEKAVIEKLGLHGGSSILDIGCGCGGLGLALMQRFGATSYTGVEINADAAEAARSLNPAATILSGDFLGLTSDDVPAASYDFVFSLSCIDWNLAFDKMLEKAWTLVKPGGYFIASFRLTDQEGINEISRSYQYINYDGRMEGEIAPYIVLNAADLASRLLLLGASRISAFGYYGAPSRTAVTPFSQLCFAAFAIQKPEYPISPSLDVNLPADITAMLEHTIEEYRKKN